MVVVVQSTAGLSGETPWEVDDIAKPHNLG